MPHTPDPNSTYTPRLGLEIPPKGAFPSTWADLMADLLMQIDAGIPVPSYNAWVHQDAGSFYAEDRDGQTILDGTNPATVLQAAITPGGMTGAPQPWDRQPAETPRAYAAFCVYRDLGVNRTVAEEAAKLVAERPSD